MCVGSSSVHFVPFFARTEPALRIRMRSGPMAPTRRKFLPLTIVCAGSIVPLGPDLQYAAEKPADPIELRIYPGADGSFTIYEDEGDTYNYEKGAFATIPIRWDNKSSTLTIGDRTGSFPGMLQQ